MYRDDSSAPCVVFTAPDCSICYGTGSPRTRVLYRECRPNQVTDVRRPRLANCLRCDDSSFYFRIIFYLSLFFRYLHNRPDHLSRHTRRTDDHVCRCPGFRATSPLLVHVFDAAAVVLPVQWRRVGDCGAIGGGQRR